MKSHILSFSLMAFALMSAVGTAQAANSTIIRWQVTNAKTDEGAQNFYYAMFKVEGVAGGYLVDAPGETGAAMLLTSSYPNMGTSTDDDNVSGFYNGTTDYADSGYSFYVELYDTSDKLLAVSSDTWNYTTLLNDIKCVTDNPQNPLGYGRLIVSDFKAVPEPTSGLMLLLGLAALGLKRKNV